MLVWKAWLACAALWFWVGLSGVAVGQPEVTKLRNEGMAAYQAGDFPRAKKAFDEAYRMAPLHTLGLWGARARVKLNEWVEADERYERLVKTPITGGDSAEEEQARRDAAREREELRHRLPRIRIKIEGVAPNEVEVRIDGNVVAPEFLIGKKAGPFPRGKSLQVNPGDHRLVGVAEDQRREVSVTLAEGQTRDVTLSFANPDTIRQRKCRDQCRANCKDDNSCYVECKRRCFTQGRP